MKELYFCFYADDKTLDCDLNSLLSTAKVVPGPKTVALADPKPDTQHASAWHKQQQQSHKLNNFFLISFCEDNHKMELQNHHYIYQQPFLRLVYVIRIL